MPMLRVCERVMVKGTQTAYTVVTTDGTLVERWLLKYA
jgi:hypothetical protein